MTSKERHQKVANEFSKLNSELEKIKDNYLEKISSTINKAIKNHEDKDLWKSSYDKIVDFFYEALTETYLKTVLTLKDAYNDNISDDIPNLEDFIYTEDGKTLQERIKGYWNEVAVLLKGSKNEAQEISLYLLSMYDRILSNEIQNVKAGIKKTKKVNDMPGLIKIIEVVHSDTCDCELCSQLEGFYLEDDSPAEPPFHVGCQCDSIPDYYDPNDPQDLEILQEAGWEEDDG